MLLFPFSPDRLFFPWRPIPVSPLGIVRFFYRAGEILEPERPFCAGSILLRRVRIPVAKGAHRGA